MGDDVWVSGTLGDARLALEVFRGTLALPPALFELARARMEMPTPRVALGLALRGIATAAIDLSDGLSGDLGHVLTRERRGRAHRCRRGGRAGCGDRGAPALGIELRRACAMAGGDDYELAFTAPASAREAVVAGRPGDGARRSRASARIEAEPGLRVVDAQGAPVAQRFDAFDHFA